MKTAARSSYPAQQQGIALVISLLLLLAITLVAVSSMQSSLLQERMSANLYDRQVSYQQVEAALLEAEVMLNVNDPVALIDGAGVYDLPVAGADDRWNDSGLQWLSATTLNDNNETGAQYLIEYMGDWPYPPECADVASKDKISVGVFITYFPYYGTHSVGQRQSCCHAAKFVQTLNC